MKRFGWIFLAALMALMLVVTLSDVGKLFGR